MKYCILTDKDHYILEIKYTNNPIRDLYELDLSQYDFSGNKKHCWKLIGDYKTDFSLEFDEQKYEYLESQEEPLRKHQRILELKANLNETDYIMAQTVENLLGCSTLLQIISVFANTLKDYKEVIDQRKAWRQEIRELEND